MLKYSRQRECILNNIQSRRDHPTADMVYECVRMEQPNISLGTVYRNLALLENNGKIHRIVTGTGPDHYDGFVDPHVHFVCNSCGKVIDVDVVPQIEKIEEASEQFEGIVEGYEVKMYGKCKDCLSMINE